MLRLLRTGRWLAFTAAALVAIVAFGLLSLWQWHRAEQKRAEFAAVEQAFSAPAVPATGVTDPADWQHVTATGRFDPQRQFLQRNQPQDGSNGFRVVTYLDTPHGGLWVVRGFMPTTAAAAAATAAPAPPAGQVTVTGYARLPDADPARPADDLPGNQVTAVNVADLDTLASVRTPPWYLLAAADPGLRPIALPEATDSRNLSYAGQWLLFAAVVVGGWFFFLRREARDNDQQPGARSRQTITTGS